MAQTQKDANLTDFLFYCNFDLIYCIFFKLQQLLMRVLMKQNKRMSVSTDRQADEAREHCKACQVDVREKRVDLANTKSEIITQLREMVSQCDLTLKAVSPTL